MQTQTQVRELMGMSVTDTHGTKVGTIKQVYLNDDSGSPEWVTVHTGWFGMRESFVPLSGARKNQDMLQVPYDKETIKGAPNVDADEHLSHAQIVDLYRHYGVRPPGGSRQGGERDAGEQKTKADAKGEAKADANRTAGDRGLTGEGKAASGTTTGTTGTAGTAGGTTTGQAAAAGTAGAAGMAVHPDRAGHGQAMPPQSAREGAEAPMTEITRSEEQLRIGTERYESGRVRVHKYVETEMVERTIPVSHEEIKIDREPIVGGEPNPKITISEDDHEIILYEERPVIAKETVPVERIHVRTEQVQDEQTVRGELRKERIEVTRDEDVGGERGTAGRGERGRRSK
ncbi:DUF2382 domain-containing protein [Actinomadura latina]|uniref:PRC and DUF2382 domain-containing protein n=1 Tax=Actinomadura latina TaxID=163603 RepID=A0A846ZE04_9ACTN|nr:PRC and DUF2382 domain-containing protein [Actinomadura latina]NKZ08206.1 PRC and DUF2382 domain-containing protein [Actinomadura latina]